MSETTGLEEFEAEHKDAARQIALLEWAGRNGLTFALGATVISRLIVGTALYFIL